MDEKSDHCRGCKDHGADDVHSPSDAGPVRDRHIVGGNRRHHFGLDVGFDLVNLVLDFLERGDRAGDLCGQDFEPLIESAPASGRSFFLRPPLSQHFSDGALEVTNSLRNLVVGHRIPTFLEMMIDAYPHDLLGVLPLLCGSIEIFSIARPARRDDRGQAGTIDPFGDSLALQATEDKVRCRRGQ